MNFLLFFFLFLQQPADDPKDLQAIVDTTEGSFMLQFYSDEAPNHVRKFIELARRGFYNGTTFHSMAAHGIVQAGDPETKDPAARAKYGAGGFNLGLKPEISRIPFNQGTIAATLLPGEPDSAGSQFLIIVTDQPQFTGQFTAFAYVTEGIEVVDKISTAALDGNQFARDRIEIKNIVVRRIPPPPPPPYSTESVEQLSLQQVVMETSKGRIVMEMTPEKASEHVRHFLRLTSLGVYDKSAFHRIAPGFVIQAGDINTKTEPVAQAAIKYVVKIRAEINDIKHTAGIISMARGEAIDSAMTSFFIVLADQPALDGTYTVFGKVTEGMEVVQAIAATPNENEKPLERVDIYSMKVVRKN